MLNGSYVLKESAQARPDEDAIRVQRAARCQASAFARAELRNRRRPEAEIVGRQEEGVVLRRSARRGKKSHVILCLARGKPGRGHRDSVLCVCFQVRHRSIPLNAPSGHVSALFFQLSSFRTGRTRAKCLPDRNAATGVTHWRAKHDSLRACLLRKHTGTFHRGPARKKWSGRPDLNGRPLAPHASALATCATPRNVSNCTRGHAACHRWAWFRALVVVCAADESA
jgi:hypothetical protein